MIDDDFLPSGLGEVSEGLHTVCHLCSGSGDVANPVLAVDGGSPHTTNPGRTCPACRGDCRLPGLQPPV